MAAVRCAVALSWLIFAPSQTLQQLVQEQNVQPQSVWGFVSLHKFKSILCLFCGTGIDLTEMGALMRRDPSCLVFPSWFLKPVSFFMCDSWWRSPSRSIATQQQFVPHPSTVPLILASLYSFFVFPLISPPRSDPSEWRLRIDGALKQECLYMESYTTTSTDGRRYIK